MHVFSLLHGIYLAAKSDILSLLQKGQQQAAWVVAVLSMCTSTMPVTVHSLCKGVPVPEEAQAAAQTYTIAFDLSAWIARPVHLGLELHERAASCSIFYTTDDDDKQRTIFRSLNDIMLSPNDIAGLETYRA